jgi:hypothetical protein
MATRFDQATRVIERDLEYAAGICRCHKTTTVTRLVKLFGQICSEGCAAFSDVRPKSFECCSLGSFQAARGLNKFWPMSSCSALARFIRWRIS